MNIVCFILKDFLLNDILTTLFHVIIISTQIELKMWNAGMREFNADCDVSKEYFYYFKFWTVLRQFFKNF